MIYMVRKMRLRVRDLDLSTGGPLVAVLNDEDARRLGIYASDRVRIKKGKREISVLVDVAENHGKVKAGCIGLFEEVLDELKLKNNDSVKISVQNKPESLHFIKDKLDGNELSKEKINDIVTDIVDNKLSEVEVGFFVSGCYKNELSLDEISYLTEAIVNNSKIINFKEKTVDKHCTGGIPANRTTMIVIPIVAAAGLIIPKTSSRAITSPSGTADVMEVLAPVDLSREKIIKTVKKTNGCIVWGGALDLASADDKIIKIERVLSLDPEGMLLSSIMAKKKAVNANYVLIDIPVGKEAKIKTKRDARRLKSKFIRLGRKLGMKVRVIISNGEQPIGNGVGPALEARDIMGVLAGGGPNDLKEKAIKIAGNIFSMVGIWNGEKKARKILESGQALGKMYEIIKAQGGKVRDIEIGRFKYSVKSSKTGVVSHISNSCINKICRILGCPKDKKAGLYLNFKLRDNVKRGQELFTLYAESKAKLDYGIEFLRKNKIMEIK